MAEGDPRAQLEHAVPHGGAPSLRSRSRARPPIATAVPGSPVGSAAASSSSRRVASGNCSTRQTEARLDPALQRQLAREAEAAGQPRWRQFTWQLEQCQWVSASLGEDPPSNALIERRVDDRCQQLARIGVRQPGKPQIREPSQLVEPRAAHAPRTRRATESAPSRRATNASTSTEERSSHWASSTRHSSGQLLGRLGQQAEHRQPDEETVGLGARAQPEGRRERVALWGGKRSSRCSSGPHSWCRPAKGSSISDSDPDRADDAAAIGALGGVIQQRGLPAPAVAAEHQDRTRPGLRLDQQSIKPSRTPRFGRRSIARAAVRVGLMRLRLAAVRLGR